MKKIGKMRIKLTTVLAGLALCLTLAACKNFMNAGKVKEEIEHAIYVNNNECPVATVEEPVFSDGGVAWNKTIIISFSLPMDPDSFIGNYTIKDSDGISVMDNYMAPEWANNNTKVVIYANELNPLIIPEGKTKDLYITLSKKCKTKDGLPIKTVINHKYRLNSINENVPPVLAPNTNVKRPLIKYNNVTITNPVTLAEGQLNAQNEDLICTTNHVKSDLEFYVEGSDFGGGKVSAKISYGLVYDVDGKTVASATQETIIEELTDKSEGENYSKTISFNFDSNPAKEYADGMYKFTVYIVDQYGLKSETEKHYFVIRDTKMAKSASALIWFESPNFRQDFTIDGETVYPAPFDSMIPTGKKIDELRQKVQFQFINDDTYYISSFDNTKIYTDKFELGNFQFLFSWGTSLDDLTAPVPPLSVTSKTVVDYYGYEIPEERVELKYTDDGVTYASWLNNWLIDTYGQELVGTGTDVRNMGNKTVFFLPLAYEEYVQNHLNKDIFMQVTVIDSVGNSNTITTVSPKKPKFYGYKVEPGENDSKKVTLSYSDSTGADLTSIVNIPDKKCIENYRIFVAALPATCDENNTDDIDLERTTVKRWVEDQYSGFTDSNVFNIPKNEDGTYSKYVVYIQPNYSTNSILSGKWTGQTFGPYYKVIIDPDKGSEGWVDPDPDTNQLPDSISILNIEHESAGQSTGLLNVTVTLSKPDDRYVPCYKTKDISNWVYPDFTISEDKTKLYFTMENPLRAPVKRIDKDSGRGPDWRQTDGKWENGSTRYLFRDDFWESVERLKGQWIYDYTYDVEIKVQASGGNSFVESAAETITLDSEKDDNIPPHQSDRITTHDSRLSLDGHYFEFNDLIIEDQAHLVKTFKYYYTPYNEAWGDNLSVLSEEQIKALPYGISKLKSNCWLDQDYDIPKNDRTGTDRIVITFCPVVPVKGLEDGKYMFFGEFSDSFGNTCIITLGKADIGTLKNKPEVSWSVESEEDGGDTIKIDFTREPYENFENYYVYIEHLDTSKGVWYSLFDGWSSLQKLNFNGGNRASLTINCKTPSYTDWDDVNRTFKEGWTVGDRHGDRDNSGNVTARHLPRWTQYKVTVQAFNTHPYDKATGTGVNWYYDMPYKEYNPAADNSNWNPYSGSFEGYINGETEYDLCTQECASCSTYMYFPGYEIDGQGKINYTEQQYDLNDVRYSFSPSDARIFSNTKYLVNVYTSIIDLGNDIDAWERKGKLIRSHFYEPRATEIGWVEGDVTPPDGVQLTNDGDEKWASDGFLYKKENGHINKYQKNDWYHPENDPERNPFSFNMALDDLYNSEETGFMYYACVVHFADDNSVISDVRSCYCN